MLTAIRRRMTWANVAMTLALVFAMTGGAYAAKKYLITSTKQISPKVLKQLKGNAGPAGAQGPAGPAGPAGANGKDGLAGKDGTNGTNGKDGAAGKNVTVVEEAPKCTEGGITVEVEGSGVKHEVCNGAEGPQGPKGSPWTAGGTLPVGATETGVLTLFHQSNLIVNEVYSTPISFPIQLAGGLEESNVHLQGEANFTTACHGSIFAPSAESGNLCIYLLGAGFKAERPGGTFTYGALMLIEALETHVTFHGAWAVTG